MSVPKPVPTLASKLQARAPSHHAPCKCGGASALPFGMVDFHKNCASGAPAVLPPAGIPIAYYRCWECGFLFTTAFDRFTPDDFRRFIYNDEYRLVDPDFETARSERTAAIVDALFPKSRTARILDYGGGNGALAQELRSKGYGHVDTYDPHVPPYATRPQGCYDLILAFEVMEHTARPKRTFQDMDRFLAEEGLILFSTLLQPLDIAVLRTDWWYLAPRNGHISLYSQKSLRKLLKPLGLQLVSINEGVHLLYRRLPAFARHLFSNLNP